MARGRARRRAGGARRNVAVKATGQPLYAEDAYPFRSFQEHLHRCFDAFGADRMFWGTDITRMPCSWRQCVTVLRSPVQLGGLAPSRLIASPAN
jgi:hypothetical protein